MAGYDAQTGKPLEGDARIAQALRRLVKTEHDLVMRRHLFCELNRLVGTPLNPIEALGYSASVAGTIIDNESRVDVISVKVANGDSDGRIQLELAVKSRETGAAIDLAEVVK